MNGNNILGAIFLTVFPVCYLLSMFSTGGFSDSYDDFCKKVECPNTENLNFDPNQVYKQAQSTAIIGAISLIGLIWPLFYIKDRWFDKKPISRDALGITNGSES